MFPPIQYEFFRTKEEVEIEALKEMVVSLKASNQKTKKILSKKYSEMLTHLNELEERMHNLEKKLYTK